MTFSRTEEGNLNLYCKTEWTFNETQYDDCEVRFVFKPILLINGDPTYGTESIYDTNMGSEDIARMFYGTEALVPPILSGVLTKVTATHDLYDNVFEPNLDTVFHF